MYIYVTTRQRATRCSRDSAAAVALSLTVQYQRLPAKGYETSITAPTTIREVSHETAPATGHGDACRRAWLRRARHVSIILGLCSTVPGIIYSRGLYTVSDLMNY